MRILSILKMISFLVSAFCVVGLAYFFIKWRDLQEKKAERTEAFFREPEVLKTSPQEEHWKRLVAMFQSNNPSDWRVALLDADSMLEELIGALGYQGDTFGDKLKAMHPSDYPWLQDAWNVHLLRNRIAHDGASFELNEREVYQAYKTYENIFYATGFLG